jgi:hypothetical protein
MSAPTNVYRFPKRAATQGTMPPSAAGSSNTRQVAIGHVLRRLERFDADQLHLVMIATAAIERGA